MPLAIGAIQEQSVPNLEIVISGDGVTIEVRAVVQGLASTDPRIVFHDFPKAPQRGGANRDRAVGLAKSARIFYSDDDDLLLPRHVETLGPILDRYDAADSPPAFVSCSGRIQIGLVNHARGMMREALAAGTAKTTFDTHFAHRKSAYERLGSPWAALSSAVAKDFFQSFAAEPSIRWNTISAVTALSFNGRTRQHVSPAARRTELERWRRKANVDGSLLDNAFYDWHIFRLARSLGAAAPRTLEGLLSATSMSVNGLSARGQSDVSYRIPEARLASLRDLFALLRREPVESAGLGDLAIRLADPLIGWPRPNLEGAASGTFTKSVGAQHMLAALNEIDGSDAYALEMRDFLECRLMLAEGKPALALKRMEKLIATGAFYSGEAHVQAALACRQLGQYKKALTWTRAAIRQDPALKTGYQLAVDMLIARRLFDEARRTCDEARAHLADHVVATIAHRIETAEHPGSERSGRRSSLVRWAARFAIPATWPLNLSGPD